MDKDFRERQEHINSEKTKDNITLRHVLLAEAYHNLFDHAQEEYNLNIPDGFTSAVR